MRERLVELLGGDMCKGCYCEDCEHENNEKSCIEHIKSRMADHLISNGVTVQQWIPVSDKPQKNGYYLCYVLTSSIGDNKKYEQVTLYWEDNLWLYRCNSYRMCTNVTHWMPLPQAPKGE